MAVCYIVLVLSIIKTVATDNNEIVDHYLDPLQQTKDTEIFMQWKNLQKTTWDILIRTAGDSRGHHSVILQHILLWVAVVFVTVCLVVCLNALSCGKLFILNHKEVLRGIARLEKIAEARGGEGTRANAAAIAERQPRVEEATDEEAIQYGELDRLDELAHMNDFAHFDEIMEQAEVDMNGITSFGELVEDRVDEAARDNAAAISERESRVEEEAREESAHPAAHIVDTNGTFNQISNNDTNSEDIFPSIVTEHATAQATNEEEIQHGELDCLDELAHRDRIAWSNEIFRPTPNIFQKSSDVFNNSNNSSTTSTTDTIPHTTSTSTPPTTTASINATTPVLPSTINALHASNVPSSISYTRRQSIYVDSSLEISSQGETKTTNQSQRTKRTNITRRSGLRMRVTNQNN